MTYRYGKGPARHKVSFRFTDFFDAKKLPTPPAVFGHYQTIPSFGMLANSQFGCCVWSGAAHETMIFSGEGGKPRARFTDHDVLSDYASTGFDITKTDSNGNNPTDNGSDMGQAADYRRKLGIIDATGTTRHKIDAYLALNVGDWNQLVIATWLFGAAGVGLNLPQEAETWFDAGKPWDIPWNPLWKPRIVGGHYVPSVGRLKNGMMPIVTWGGEIPMSRKFYERFSDEALAYVSLEVLNSKGLSPEGYDADELHKHLANLGART